MSLKEPMQPPLWKLCAERAVDAQARGDLKDAEKQYRLSVAIARHTYDSSPESVGEALMALADFLSVCNRYLEAEEVYRETIKLYDHLFGSSNLVSDMVYRVLADMYNRQEERVNRNLLNARRPGHFGLQAS